MRFLTADYLYPLHTSPIKEGVLQVSDQNEVISIFQDRNQAPINKLEIFKGILCPGFINAHCHLELSCLFEKAKKGQGLLEFIKIMQQRGSISTEENKQAIRAAEKEMVNNGIVAVGDICNTSDTLFQKKPGNLKYVYKNMKLFLKIT